MAIVPLSIPKYERVTSTSMYKSMETMKRSATNFQGCNSDPILYVSHSKPIRDDDYRGKCKYKTGKCFNERAKKQNGNLHNLCEFHRLKANRNQRRLDRKKHKRKARIHSPVYPASIDHYRTQPIFKDLEEHPLHLGSAYSVSAVPPISTMQSASHISGVMPQDNCVSSPGRYVPVEGSFSRQNQNDSTTLHLHDLTYLEKSLQSCNFANQPYSSTSTSLRRTPVNNMNMTLPYLNKTQSTKREYRAPFTIPSYGSILSGGNHPIKDDTTPSKSDLSQQEVEMIISTLGQEDFINVG